MCKRKMTWLSSIKSIFRPAKEVNEAEIQRILQAYILPNGQSLQHCMKNVELQQRTVQLTLLISNIEKEKLQVIHDELAHMLIPQGVEELNLHIVQQKETATKQEKPSAEATQYDPNNPPITKKAPLQQNVPAHPKIKNVVVVSSGKGGVGKSTTTVNLALALQKLGFKIGVLDADIYGPSIPTMLGNAGQTPKIENENFVPLDAYGMAVISIGHLIGAENTPVAWRGAKATGALMQLFNQTLWPDLDILLIDMPPGTGDIQLTLAQRIPVAGAVIVTTPQNVALLDAQKGVELFNKVSIPVLGVVENMSYHICENCGVEAHIFGQGGAERLAEQYTVPVLGYLPLNTKIRENADNGLPSVLEGDESAEEYLHIARNVLQALQKIPKRERDDKRFF